MKHFIFIAAILACTTIHGQTRLQFYNDSTLHRVYNDTIVCKPQLVERFYLRGKLVHTQVYDSIIVEKGCAIRYTVRGVKIIADSVITTFR